MYVKLPIALAGFGRAKGFASVGVACNDRTGSGLACRQRALALLNREVQK
jgi:hypothetical protein